MPFDCESYLYNKCLKLDEFFIKNSRKSCVIGVSGGVDSSTVLGILTHYKKNFNPSFKIVAVICPIYNKGCTEQEEALNLGIQVCEHFDIDPIVLDGNVMGSNLKTICELTTKDPSEYLLQQISYWGRPMAFYNEAMKNDNSILVSTVNQSEWMLGWFSQYLDVLGVHPIVELYKSEVYQLAKYFNIPNSITNTSPKGGLANSNSDEDELGFTYNQFEQVMTNPESVDSEILYRVNKRIEDTKFKRFRFDLKFIYSTSVGFEI